VRHDEVTPKPPVRLVATLKALLWPVALPRCVGDERERRARSPHSLSLFEPSPSAPRMRARKSRTLSVYGIKEQQARGRSRGVFSAPFEQPRASYSAAADRGFLRPAAEWARCRTPGQ
jgi:hypothetical protein